MQTHGLSRHAAWKIFAEFSEKHSALVVRVQQSRTLPGLLDPEDEDAVLCRNVGEY